MVFYIWLPSCPARLHHQRSSNQHPDVDRRYRFNRFQRRFAAELYVRPGGVGTVQTSLLEPGVCLSLGSTIFRAGPGDLLCICAAYETYVEVLLLLDDWYQWGCCGVLVFLVSQDFSYGKLQELISAF